MLCQIQVLLQCYHCLEAGKLPRVSLQKLEWQLLHYSRYQLVCLQYLVKPTQCQILKLWMTQYTTRMKMNSLKHLILVVAEGCSKNLIKQVWLYKIKISKIIGRQILIKFQITSTQLKSRSPYLIESILATIYSRHKSSQR